MAKTCGWSAHANANNAMEGSMATRKAKKRYQTGRQTLAGYAADKRRKAKAPGTRKSASGRRYTERRVNRSDMDRRRRV